MTTKNKRSDKTISVVCPAYKQEKIIVAFIKSMKKILDELNYKYELIVVVDGKLDKTFEIAEKYSRRYKNILITGYLNNMGKGHAVRYGMAQAKGDIVGFVDVGADIDVDGLTMLLEHMKWYDADIVVGSKRHPVSKVTYPWQRRIISFVYQMYVRVLFGLNIKDTQVGMKFFRREVLKRVLPRLLVKEFAFDIEILSVSNYLGYSRIFEAPINLEMEFRGSSTVTKGFIRTVYSMVWDTAAVFYRLKILKYYDDKNKDNWITPEYLAFPQK